jgi:guanine deaminase
MTQKYRARVLTPTSPTTTSYLPDALVTLESPGEGGRIAAIQPFDPNVTYEGPPFEDLHPGVLVPGFVDGHVHYPQTRIVGQATGPLLDWLARSTFPEEARFAERSHAEKVARRFCEKLAAAGTTTALVYGPVFPDAVRALLHVAENRGQELIAGPVLMDDDCPEALRFPKEKALPALSALVDEWHGRSGCEIAVIPRFALSCTREMMEGAAQLARDRSLRVSTHLSESPEECRLAALRFGTRDYLEVYEQAGLVKPGTVLAHCIHLSEGEWDRLAAAGAVVAHCPDSNDFLGSGGMSTPRLLARRVDMVLGTDVAAGRTFRVGRIASSAYDNALRQGLRPEAATVWWWATRGAARALGRDAGLVAPGGRADLALFDPPEWANSADDVLAALLFDHDAPAMRKTWVAGRVVHEARARI